jgi:Mn2+/Fe2+ NRAMP family transporter
MSAEAVPDAGASGVTSPATLTYPPPSRELSSGWLALLKVFGPGALIASVTVATGETIFAPRVGAVFGYAMFWTILVAVGSKALLVYSGARHLVLTGEHPMEAWTRFPGPRGWVPALMGVVAVVAFPIWIAALSDALSSLCVWMTGLGAGTTWGRPAWATLFVVAVMTLTIVQTYNVVERVSAGILVLKIVFVFVACVVARPDWWAALAGLVRPSWPEYPAWIGSTYPEMTGRPPLLEICVLLGTVGGGVQDYLGYVGCMREKAWGASASAVGGPERMSADPEQVRRGRVWLRAPAFDVLISFAAVLVITTSFMLLGAAVLNPRREIPTNADLYSRQAQFLGLIHPSLVGVYKAGIFFAIFGALYGTFEVYARTLYEPLKALWPRRAWKFERIRLWNTSYCGLGGLVILWTGMHTVTLASVISPFSGVLGCGLWCLAMVAVDRHLPLPYRMGTALRMATLIAGLGMALTGGYVTWMSWRG